VDGAIKLNEDAKPILKDGLAILCSKVCLAIKYNQHKSLIFFYEIGKLGAHYLTLFSSLYSPQNIKLSSTRTQAAEDFADEGDEAGAAMANARTKFLTQVGSTDKKL
jgi:hypothetical protein